MCSKPKPSPYRNNYGYGEIVKDQPSPFGDAERQWYIDNGFGDPTQQIAGEKSTTGVYRPSPFKGSGPNRIQRKVYATLPYYRGVSPEARMLYTTAADRAKAVSDASAQYAQERANSTSVRASDEGVRYNYAGAALGIPG